MFKYTLDNKRYHTLNYFYKNKFGVKIFKLSLNGGFTCPNLDGTKGFGGCTYCSKTGSGEFGGNRLDSLTKQVEDMKKIVNKKNIPCKYIGYFQARTNTYAPVSKLKSMYEEVLACPDIIGLNIATRPDAITDECLNYLTELNKRTFLTIELGLQTIHDKTAKLINRCHTLDEFNNMVEKLKERHINIVVHIMNGLPFETEEDMLETVKYLNTLDIQGIKIHMLSILKDTKPTKILHIINRHEYVIIKFSSLLLFTSLIRIPLYNKNA